MENLNKLLRTSILAMEEVYIAKNRDSRWAEYFEEQFGWPETLDNLGTDEDNFRGLGS